MSPYAIVGFGALAVVVVGWLVVSFTAPSPRRAVVEWVAATFLYVAITSAVARGTLAMWERELWVVVAALGFLLCILAAAGIVSFVHIFLSLREPAKEQQSATN